MKLRSIRKHFLEAQYICRILLLIIAFTIPLTASQTTTSQLTVKDSDRLTETTNDKKVQDKKLLPDDADETLRQMALEIISKNRSGLDYLNKSGLNLIIVLPSLEQIVNSMRQQHQEGKIDDATIRFFEKKLESASYEERTKVKYVPVGLGFEPATTLPRPYGLKSQEGQIINISENFMKRFQVTTEYDLMRIIRNSSIILSNFSGSKDQDNFKVHKERLLQDFSNVADQNLPDQRISAIFRFTASLMIIDTLLPPTDIILTTEEFYVASLVIGTVFKLF